MTTATTPRMTRTLAAEYRGRLMAVAHETRIPPGIRLFHEGGRADQFWIIRSGAVTLDLRVPGGRPTVVETLGPGELLGRSWLFAPYRWRFGAETAGPVRAHEFDAGAVRRMCADDPGMGRAIARWVGDLTVHRLRAVRTGLLALHGAEGGGCGG
ncbi:cyclic nucleotide-binding domain-containing protein [Streptomyces sp. NPDC000983]|uniref:cyclic nucleotide-binding domain-containing protein n=1 Tax=Streptomyces sp. NPDC000983 TaxID=3154373 RepID=UPI0033217436